MVTISPSFKTCRVTLRPFKITPLVLLRSSMMASRVPAKNERVVAAY